MAVVTDCNGLIPIEGCDGVTVSTVRLGKKGVVVGVSILAKGFVSVTSVLRVCNGFSVDSFMNVKFCIVN